MLTTGVVERDADTNRMTLCCSCSGFACYHLFCTKHSIGEAHGNTGLFLYLRFITPDVKSGFHTEESISMDQFSLNNKCQPKIINNKTEVASLGHFGLLTALGTNECSQ